METPKPIPMQAEPSEVKQDPPVKAWGVMTGKERWTYTWHVIVMLCTGGFVFPNAIIS
ncbi:hypothetical protein SAMN06265795_104295 [Noviherbaspirillum humi]|uniref:Uncharacterized protein n=1 Tax=Noviherbaspirillum humi TaxID=1688639 RepID=A0A239G9B1_9BURK|nr:hypothetical protein SAMN06265795_104295 [Noviherbaspirillum humi]